MRTVHLEISGRVQGVFFRAKAKEVAEIHKVTGWIRNTDEGTVEACVSGEVSAVEKFIDWCRSGPEKATVENVEVTDLPVKEFDRFKVIR